MDGTEHLAWTRAGQGLAGKNRADSQSTSANQKALQLPASDNWSITTLRSLDIGGSISSNTGNMDAEDSPWGGAQRSLHFSISLS